MEVGGHGSWCLVSFVLCLVSCVLCLVSCRVVSFVASRGFPRCRWMPGEVSSINETAVPIQLRWIGGRNGSINQSINQSKDR
ncbi:hypothetical protein EYC84_000575 [Monilinia fructicola]|uniref:Uncharacterized protein n=1 Tax=Monilinia fructicola TaxID=38448 RepID=A0A5M9JS59_MONFR|nr:hypothetical protein EYC84_000575 [Monilinia fructicola]